MRRPEANAERSLPTVTRSVSKKNRVVSQTRGVPVSRWQRSAPRSDGGPVETRPRTPVRYQADRTTVSNRPKIMRPALVCSTLVTVMPTVVPI